MPDLRPGHAFAVGDAGVCPGCGGRDTIIGYLLHDETGRHQHTHYACTRWVRASPDDDHPFGQACGWHGWIVPEATESQQAPPEGGVKAGPSQTPPARPAGVRTTNLFPGGGVWLGDAVVTVENYYRGNRRPDGTFPPAGLFQRLHNVENRLQIHFDDEGGSPTIDLGPLTRDDCLELAAGFLNVAMNRSAW